MFFIPGKGFNNVVYVAPAASKLFGCLGYATACLIFVKNIIDVKV